MVSTPYVSRKLLCVRRFVETTLLDVESGELWWGLRWDVMSGRSATSYPDATQDFDFTTYSNHHVAYNPSPVYFLAI